MLYRIQRVQGAITVHTFLNKTLQIAPLTSTAAKYESPPLITKDQHLDTAMINDDRIRRREVPIKRGLIWNHWLDIYKIYKTYLDPCSNYYGLYQLVSKNKDEWPIEVSAYFLLVSPPISFCFTCVMHLGIVQKYLI